MLKLESTQIRIVLVEAKGPLNVGSVARIMKNMGLNHLVLVNPQCDPYGAEARQMAVHGVEILEKATIVPTLPEALKGCHRAIATTSLDRSLPTHLENPKHSLPWLLGYSGALIFGREDRGLTNVELNYAQRFVRIQSDDSYPSLNLAQAVAICCYELYQAQLNQENNPQSQANRDLEASLDVLEAYYQDLETILLKIGYLYPHTASSRMEKFRRLYNRAYPSTQEVAMLRGMIRQINWALSNYDHDGT
ncbi:RNA methyltransferase, TrmH family, group 1 [Trichodesmium erythraeum IMS101]|uniref:tRNA (cytidine/uridine-2'-O-)-methyltransferase TrmJ n=1 Tax=Trichodesmium erythraeum (strain IMS101) TaxID=203124 RepID=Q10XW1_TRIEI|nr:RNA methyltransferase [Trichodesmium erythraeum GBRTRLIN201]MCH2049417.1 RNA methyltransferase [Trichodesmium sp. ALOHA_ZT_67]MDE5092730.1 RNA methyltransferase [Trichodesmium sp. St11_bin5]MDT9340578.1 RNA methyltransferase [Trichodesmium erythraeum 21-75]